MSEHVGHFALALLSEERRTAVMMAWGTRKNRRGDAGSRIAKNSFPELRAIQLKLQREHRQTARLLKRLIQSIIRFANEEATKNATSARH